MEDLKILGCRILDCDISTEQDSSMRHNLPTIDVTAIGELEYKHEVTTFALSYTEKPDLIDDYASQYCFRVDSIPNISDDDLAAVQNYLNNDFNIFPFIHKYLDEYESSKLNE